MDNTYSKLDKNIIIIPVDKGNATVVTKTTEKSARMLQTPITSLRPLL